jgi:hypothetical protein
MALEEVLRALFVMWVFTSPLKSLILVFLAVLVCINPIRVRWSVCSVLQVNSKVRVHKVLVKSVTLATLQPILLLLPVIFAILVLLLQYLEAQCVRYVPKVNFLCRQALVNVPRVARVRTRVERVTRNARPVHRESTNPLWARVAV